MEARDEGVAVVEEIGGGDAHHAPAGRLQQLAAFDVAEPLLPVHAVTIALILEGDTPLRVAEVRMQGQPASIDRDRTIDV